MDEGTAARQKVSIVIGHTADRRGAFAVEPIGMYEYEFNTGLAQTLMEILSSNYDVKIFFRDNVGIFKCYEYVAEWGPAVNLELHFNSSETIAAYGTETLCTDRSRVFAGMVQQAMCQALGRTKGNGDRGIKILTTPEERGYVSVSRLKCPNIIIEPFFGQNSKDCALMLTSIHNVCIGISNAIQNYLSLS